MALKTKRDKYDITFSKFILLRDVCCQKCGRSQGKLECSHIFSRRHQGTRCDPDNAKLLCFTCHRWWHENPPEAIEWLKGIVGQQKYDRLRIKANTPTKMKPWDKDAIRAYLLIQIKKMEGGESMASFNKLYSGVK